MRAVLEYTTESQAQVTFLLYVTSLHVAGDLTDVIVSQCSAVPTSSMSGCSTRQRQWMM